MNPANPFQAPQHEENTASGDPSRPKPWSPLSVLATAIVLVFVGASWWFVREPPFTEQLPNQWNTYFDHFFIGINLLYLQAIVLGFWLGGGSTPILLRSFLAVLLLVGLGWETVQLFGSHHWEVTIRIALLVATLTAIIDALLWGISSHKKSNRILQSLLVVVLAPLAYGGVYFYYWKIIDLPEYYFFAERIVGPMANFLALACSGAMGGIVLLTWKHRLSRWSYLGVGAVLVLAPFGVSLVNHRFAHEYRPAFPWFLLLAYELASLVLLHSLQRLLRTYGSSLVEVSWSGETERETTSERPT